jgi:hypothetical protein
VKLAELNPLESAEKFSELFFDDRVWVKDPNEDGYLRGSDVIPLRDAAIVNLCADRLAERGHHHAANSLRKMLRDGKLLP